MKSYYNSAIRKLEADDILYLEAVSPKSKNVFLTEKGRKLANHTAMRIIQIENDIFASWSKEDVNKYLELTERFLLEMKKNADII